MRKRYAVCDTCRKCSRTVNFSIGYRDLEKYKSFILTSSLDMKLWVLKTCNRCAGRGSY